MLTKEELAKKFIDAGYDMVDIAPEDLEVLGLRMQKTFKSKSGRTIRIKGWESLCAFVYEKITGEPHPGSRLSDRMPRSQSFGKDVAEAIRSSVSKEDAAAQVIADAALSHEKNPFNMKKWLTPREDEVE